MYQRDLFISHSSGDAEVARELRVLLEDAGYTCWMAPDDVTGADPWAEQILGAIQGSRAMLVLVSSHSNASPHVAREVGLAAGRDRPVLPIRLEAVSPEGALEYHLAGLQRMDAFPPPLAGHSARILRRLGLILPREVVAPPPEPASRDESTPAVDRPTEPLVPPAAAGPVSPSAPIASLLPAAPPEPAVPGIGSRIGGFTIESVLGEGGMATVYRAMQDEPRRAVALKLIRADHAADPTYHARFLAEKDTLAALEHPSIVPIHDAGEASGQLFIAMRLVDGPDLARRLASAGRLSLDETVATLRPVADAIDYAHEMGVVHRDIKPSNILLDRKGRPYVTDFGLGKSIDRPRDLSAGVAVGTLAYMAPEQFSGTIDSELAGRIDIYALGCVAYACLTGQPPFRADEPERVMYGHVQGPIPDVGDARPDLPAAVGTAIRRALAKEPRDRYATASEFVSTLAVAAEVSDDKTAPVPISSGGRPGGFGAWARANSMLAGSAATLAALVIIAAGVLAFGQPTPSESPGPGGTRGAVGSGPSSSPAPGTAPPTLPPTGSPSPPPTPSPSPPPTPSPAPSPTPAPTQQPGPTEDNKAPTGARVSITKNTVYARSVDLTLKASGASRMRIGNAPSQSGDCSYGPSRKYSETYKDWTINGGAAGTKWVCVEFRDAAGNTSTDRDSVYFDHPPDAISGTFKYAEASNRLYWCDYLAEHSHIIPFPVLPTLASDEDGDPVTLTTVTRAGNTFPPEADGKTVRIQYNYDPSVGFGYFERTYNFTVKDDHGGTDSSTFVVQLGPCPGI